MIDELQLYIPRSNDGWFYVKMMSDPETMAYNAPWFPPDGCIPDPDSGWVELQKSWIGKAPERFYAFLQRKTDGTFVGDVNYHHGAQNGITVKSNSDSELGMRLVAYLPELHCAVDIAGATVTEKREQSVKAHICQSNRLGYYLIKRTADASQMAAEIKTLFIRNHIYLHTDSEKDVQVLRERFLEWKYRNACKLNGKY